jgi:cobaltochelatase CobN
MRIAAVMWDSLYPLVVAAGRGRDVAVHANRRVDASEEEFDLTLKDISDSDVVLLYRTTHAFWDRLIPEVEKISSGRKVICVGQDPTYWGLSNVEPKVCSDVYAYLLNGTEENMRRMLRYLDHVFADGDEPEPPLSVPWQGIVHQRFAGRVFESTEEYLAAYELRDRPLVALVISRSAWISGQGGIEEAMVSDLEAQGLGVIPIMTTSLHNGSTGSMNIAECFERFILREGKPIVQAVVKMVTFMVGKIPSMSQEEAAKASCGLLKGMNVPIFQPIISYEMSYEDWTAADSLSSDIAWGIAMPEFEGMIEPIMLGATRDGGDDCYNRTPIPGRSRKIAERVSAWVSLRSKPVSERRVVIILNNNPCASVEANIGSASGLDSLRSAVNILSALRKNGYNVNVPDDAESLAGTFTDRKATSEFRWTSVQDIVSCGGAVHRMGKDEYIRYFDTLPEASRKKVLDCWGDPPGQSMVMDGTIVITGIPLGNAVIAVQPKRGCYGPRCDGTVCKILHDPACPPTHQYLATYHYFRDIFGADAIVHVGTHGSTEFLPGKGVGLSEECFPDICIGSTPMIYVYNTDNPAEGSIAKRRCYATLIGHMQTPMSASGLYGGMLTLDSLLAQYDTAGTDRARKHALHHMILDALKASGIGDIGVDHSTPMDEAIRRCHEALTRVRTTRIEDGMHTFGEMPEKKKLVELIASILRYDEGRESTSPRRVVAKMLGADYSELLGSPDGRCEILGVSNGEAIELIDGRSETLIKLALSDSDVGTVCEAIGGNPVEGIEGSMEHIRSVAAAIHDSDEMGSMLNALSGGFVPPGPSGYMTRGREDVLPTGRNFYSLDPKRIPTTASWRVGGRLADALVNKYVKDKGKEPESVAFQWMTSDVMATDGEMMAEIMALIGVEPIWEPNGHVNRFRILSKDEMRHPRIDVTVRISGILRDNFPNCVDLVDAAVCAIADLDEPADFNFIRKHVAESEAKGISREEATARLFSSKPGTYASGVNLAVLSGAWKDEKDLAEIYISTNGYAYGNGRKGKESHVGFAADLQKVSLTFNKVATDEHDLLGCCCYYSNQGGMTAAARDLSGGEVMAYYGDTREAESVGVRTLADEIRRVSRAKLLNPAWIEGMKEHGYKGAADMMKKITRVYGWQASTHEVDDAIMDDIAKQYINDEEMRQFFADKNPYAAEEIARRLLEAESRGLWKADPKVLDDLRNNYVEIESWMEDRMGEGDVQGGSVDIVPPSEIDGLGKEIQEVMSRVHKVVR